MAEWSDSGWWQVGITGFGAVVAALSAWGSWTLRHSFVPRDEFDASVQKSEDRDVQIQTRITELETQIKHLPTSESLDIVRNQTTRLCAETEGLRRMMESVDQRLGLLYEHLLSKETR
ncbi:MAG: DUF2730 domain-containing protein [Magnetococcus sp. DMHC-8]